MKLSHLSKIVATGTFALSTAILLNVFPASAQTDNIPDSTVDDSTTDTTTDYRAADDGGFDWGWLGLLGLGGLAGLAGRRDEPVRYRDTTPTEGQTTTRY